MLELVSDRGLASAPPSTPVQRQQTRIKIPDLSSLKSSMFHQVSNHSQKLDADRTMYLRVKKSSGYSIWFGLKVHDLTTTVI